VSQLTTASPEFIAKLDRELPGVMRDVEPRYLEEPRKLFTGIAAAVARPRNTGEVAAVVRACAADHVPIVPYGGGTGLVGGQVMTSGPSPLILSLEAMDKIESVDPVDNVLVAEAGVTLERIQHAAQDVGRLFPLSLASQGSCQIGGNLATNAGGVQVLAYGSARSFAPFPHARGFCNCLCGCGKPGCGAETAGRDAKRIGWGAVRV